MKIKIYDQILITIFTIQILIISDIYYHLVLNNQTNSYCPIIYDLKYN